MFCKNTKKFLTAGWYEPAKTGKPRQVDHLKNDCNK
jgi:hypothetical protein